MQKPTLRDLFGYVVDILLVAFGMALYAKSAINGCTSAGCAF